MSLGHLCFNELVRTMRSLAFFSRYTQPRSQGSLLPPSLQGAGRREPWERGCAIPSGDISIEKPYTEPP